MHKICMRRDVAGKAAVIVSISQSRLHCTEGLPETTSLVSSNCYRMYSIRSSFCLSWQRFQNANIYRRLSTFVINVPVPCAGPNSAVDARFKRLFPDEHEQIQKMFEVHAYYSSRLHQTCWLNWSETGLCIGALPWNILLTYCMTNFFLLQVASISVARIMTPCKLTGGSGRESRGLGTGFVWDEHGHIVTNFHVRSMHMTIFKNQRSPFRVHVYFWIHSA